MSSKNMRTNYHMTQETPRGEIVLFKNISYISTEYVSTNYKKATNGRK